MPQARLIYADSERSADMYYATGLFAPDPFLFLQDSTGTTHVVVSSLEIDRARRVARVDQVHDWASVQKLHKAQSKKKQKKPALLSSLMVTFLREHGVKSLLVPAEFPLALADKLRREGVSLAAAEGLFWPERAIKRSDEVAAIEEALRITGLGMDAGIGVIRASEIGADSLLYLEGTLLTSERVRSEINATLTRLGAMPSHTIVSGGDQGADPHEEGHGPLPGNRPIIIDIFPRVEKSGYFGDMTRTVCRGQAPERVKRAWDLVFRGQELAFERIRDGVSGKEIHDAITELFTKNGFPTERQADGRQGGFFHGTGHGLGLEIHESPRISGRDQILKSGHVVTVEPGLYYPDMGGVRLEDVVVVEPDGCRNLTDVPKFLELPM
ncbi:MAG: aminopeptidase P family protein [Magnetococcales bacterium]|nr:aminopeptidase P family protein [Magnetococcales bacterium]